MSKPLTSLPPLTARAARVEPSITLALSARARALRAEGRDVIDMAVGEPDFAAPEVVQGAAVEKVRSGDVRYTPAAGIPALREAVAKSLQATRGVTWSPAEVCITHSSKHALTGALLATVEEGDEVLIPLPAWSSYFDIVRICGARPVGVPPHPETLRPDLEALARAVTERTRVLMLNSPNNPSGLVFTPEEIGALTELALAHGLWILSDEIYHGLAYDGPVASPAQHSSAAREVTLLVDGASKVFAMTGYRIGFLAGPEHVTAAVGALQSQMTGSPNAVSQAAYLAALRSNPPEVDVMREAFRERRDALLERLRDLGLETPHPAGAFYAFPSVAAHLDAGGSPAFCEALLETQALALVPGSAFGCPDHVRLSYALDLETLHRAVDRLARFLADRP